jgi:hypothetical protein
LTKRTEQLLARLNAIGESLKNSGQALALLGLGSVGDEVSRIDDYSDLDFFAIVREGSKARFLNRLDWLESIHPIAYAFQNTPDGYKLLFADDIFCEYAIFEPHELPAIPFAVGRIIWKVPDFDESLAIPSGHTPSPLESTVEWLLGECLTNLYVGLMRLKRGEVLSAQRFIQHYAANRVLELAAQIETPTEVPADQFSIERRFEVRYPQTAAHLPEFVQGYDRSHESACAILGFVDAHFDVNPVMKARILALCDEA